MGYADPQMSNEVHNWLNTLMCVVILAAVIEGAVLGVAVIALAAVVFKGFYNQLKHDNQAESQGQEQLA